MKKVRYINLPLQFENTKSEIMDKITEICTSGSFILGKELSLFEKNFSSYVGTKHALGVGNGTDAMIMIMKALRIGPGDEVITAPNSFIASTSSIILAGAKPVFVDSGSDFNINVDLIEAAITKKTKAILPIHLTGKPANMSAIMKIAKTHDLFVIEDAAQSIGSTHDGKKVGSIGTCAAFSLHPLKNLNVYGDGGVITTDSDKLYQKLLQMRNHGLKNRDESEFWGFNSRLDCIQAGIANVRFKHLNEYLKRIDAIANMYREELTNIVVVPKDGKIDKTAIHTFVIKCKDRDELKDYLEKNGIGTKIHYPIPIHLQEAAKELGYKKGDFPQTETDAEQILSLPIYPELTDEDVEYVITQIKSFYRSR